MNYNIEGEPLPVVICNLEANETMITEKGAMSWMTPNMKMETTSNGGIGKMFGRAFSGESMFQNRYTSMGGPGMIAFASCFPGCIRPFQIAPGQEIIVELIHDAFKVWGVFCPPWSRHCRGLGIQYPVLVCPLRYRDVLWWL